MAPLFAFDTTSLQMKYIGKAGDITPKDESSGLVTDELLFEVMISHVRAVNEDVLETIEGVEKTIDALTLEKEASNDGRG